jgi:tRNA (cmo5U34)-methyltransferase
MSEGWRPESYLSEIKAELPLYDQFQQAVVDATLGTSPRRGLELGVGTGETARRVLAAHPALMLVGVDGNADMLGAAAADLPSDRVHLRLGRLEGPLPSGPFDLVVSALAIHHLKAFDKAALFRRIAGALAAHGRFVLGDVVVPDEPEDAVTPIEDGFDFPDSVEEQLSWLDEAGLAGVVVWRQRDLAVVRAERRPR